MARQRTDVIEASAAPALDESKFQALSEKANELIVLNDQDQANVKAMAVQFGYTGPVDSDSLEQMCQIKGAAAANSIFEFGAALVMLRESCLHGDWMVRFERMSISRRTAHNYMAIALKFKGVDVRAALGKLGVNKLLELAALDDGEIDALAAGESVRGITIGQVDKMSVLELKKKISDLEANLKATKEVASGKEEKINDLTRKANKFNFRTDWPSQVNAAIDVVDKYSAESEKFLGVVMQACTQAMEAAPKDAALEPDWVQGSAALAVRVRDAVARQRQVTEAADEHFRSTLGLYLED